MKRRDMLVNSMVIAGISGGEVFAAESNSKRFGNVITPPEKEMGKEKHVPFIDAPAQVKAGESFQVTVEVGKIVPHPNVVEHYIKWIQLYALEEGSEYVVNLGTFEFSPVRTHPKVTVTLSLSKSATLYALEYCNIHGVWDNAVEIKVGV